MWRESVFVENHSGLPWSEVIVLMSPILMGLTGLLLRAQIIMFSMNQVTMTNKAAPRKKMVAARRKE